MVAEILAAVESSVAVVVATDSLAPVGSWAEERPMAENEIEPEAGHSFVANSLGVWGVLGSSDLGRQKAPEVLEDIADTGLDTESFHNAPEAG